jgi:hypothetical protein
MQELKFKASTGEEISVWADKYGDSYRKDGGPSLTIKSPNGILLREIWLDEKTNAPGRADDKPAIVSYHEDGSLSEETWVNSKGHAYKSVYQMGSNTKTQELDPKTGIILETCRDEDGNIHNENGPAVRKIDSKYDRVLSEEHYKHGMRHNPKGAAVTKFEYESFFSNKSKIVKEYFLNGLGYSEEEYQNILDKKTSTIKTKNKTKTMKDKLKAAGTRIATRKLVKGLQNLLADQMTKNIKGAKTRSAAKEGILSFLESEAGKGALGILLGTVLPQAKSLPMLEKYGDKIDLVAEEFQIEGMAVVGEVAVDALADLVEPATALLSAYMESITAEEQVRVVADTTEKTAPAVAAEEEELELSAKKDELKQASKKH